MVGGSNPPIPTTNLASNFAPGGDSPTEFRRYSDSFVTKSVTKTAPRPPDWLRLLLDLQEKGQWPDRDLARALGVSRSYFCLLRHGQRPLRLALSEKAAAIVRSYARESGQSVNSIPPFFAYYSVETENRLDLEQHIDNFMLAKQVEGKSPATLKFYRENLRRFLWWLEQNSIPRQLKALDANVIRTFLAYVQTATHRWKIGSKSSEHQASMSTVDGYWRTFQSLFTWLVKENVLDIKENPIKKIPRPRCQQKIVRDIPLELIRQALAQFGRSTFLGARNCAIILMLLDTGMRLSECSGINLADINLESGLIRVLGKGGVERLVRIGKTARAALQLYLAKRQPSPLPQLWLNKDGRPLGKAGLQIMVRRLSKLGGNVRWSPHTFRNTFAINFLRRGGDPFTLQILGGWTDLEMPRHYTAALKAEDAFRVHVRASPADALSRRSPRRYN